MDLILGHSYESDRRKSRPNCGLHSLPMDDAGSHLHLARCRSRDTRLNLDPTWNSRRSLREHRERIGWGTPTRGESSPVKLILAWPSAHPGAPCRAVSRRVEVNGAARKIFTVNLPPFYRVLQHPSASLGTPQHISTRSTNSLITNYLVAQVFVFLGAASGPALGS